MCQKGMFIGGQEWYGEGQKERRTFIAFYSKSGFIFSEEGSVSLCKKIQEKVG